MKLDKAIEILTDQVQNPDMSKFPDLKDSIHLAIEALKHFQQWRNYTYHAKYLVLPGEDNHHGRDLSDDEKKKLRESPLGKEPKDTSQCPFTHIRDYPGCYEDCPDVKFCPHSTRPKE